jgi:DNA polymerase III subunit delta'
MITFGSIPFHHKQKEQIIQAFHAGRNSHAQLFYGPAGNGKYAAALAYAATLLCHLPGEKGACGQCPSCRQVSAFTHPDIQFIFPTYVLKSEKVNGLSEEFIKPWRQMLARQLYFEFNDWKTELEGETRTFGIRVDEAAAINRNLTYKSYSGGYKVVLIWLPEQMNEATANKLLKNIEEPESKTMIIMVSEKAEDLLATIRSRVQTAFFPRLSEEDVRGELERRGVENAQMIAQLSEGNLNVALNMALHAGDMDVLAQQFAQWMRVCYTVNMTEIIKLADQVSKNGREHVKAFLQFSAQTIRQAVLSKYRSAHFSDNPVFANSDFKMKNFATLINIENAHALLQVLDDAQQDITRNVNPKIVLTDLSIRIHYLLKRGVLPALLEV